MEQKYVRLMSMDVTNEADKFNVCKGTIKNIVQNKTYTK